MFEKLTAYFPRFCASKLTHSDGVPVIDATPATTPPPVANVKSTLKQIPAEHYQNFISDSSKRRKPNTSACRLAVRARALTSNFRLSSPESLPSRAPTRRHLPARRQAQPRNFPDRLAVLLCALARLGVDGGRRGPSRPSSCWPAIWVDGGIRAIRRMDRRPPSVRAQEA